jgi:hypothetical protein
MKTTASMKLTMYQRSQLAHLRGIVLGMRYQEQPDDDDEDDDEEEYGEDDEEEGAVAEAQQPKTDSIDHFS